MDRRPPLNHGQNGSTRTGSEGTPSVSGWLPPQAYKWIRLAARASLGIAVTLVVMASVSGGCTRMSLREKNESAGLNGSFEIVQSGLPVNWYFHYPPLKNKDTEVSLDQTAAVAGKQSLKFVVHRVGAGRGWRSPGLFQVMPAKSKRTYKATFWLKNQGSEVLVVIRSEKPKMAPPVQRRVLGDEETGTNTWRQFEYVYTVPEDYDNIRFELGIVKPGALWIDDVRIEEAQFD